MQDNNSNLPYQISPIEPQIQPTPEGSTAQNPTSQNSVPQLPKMPTMPKLPSFKFGGGQKKIFIILGGLLAIILILLVVSVVVKGIRSRQVAATPTPTPTVEPLPTPGNVITSPSRYATDSGVIEIDQNIRSLDQDMNAANFRSMELNPPSIYFDKAF